MKRIALVLIMVALACSAIHAAETEIGATLYTTYMLNLTNGAGNANAFSVDRAYLNFKTKLSEQTSVRLTTDLRMQGNLYDVIFKYAYFDWQPLFAQKYLTLRLGLQPMSYIGYMEDLWARRYVWKMALDEEKCLSTSDLGGSAIVGLGKKAKYGTVSATIYNGTAYTDVGELNKQKDFDFVAQFKPLVDNDLYKRTTLVGQVYLGTQNKTMGDTLIITRIDSEHSDTAQVTVKPEDWKRQIVSIGGLLAYRNTADLGFDVSFATFGRGPVLDEVKKSLVTMFGAFNLSELVDSASVLRTLGVFGRVDLIDPNTDNDNDGKTMIAAGIECSPIKGFRASVNYRTTRFQDDHLDSQDFVYLNTEVKF